MPDEARADLNEAITRDPNAPSVRILLAEIAIQDGKAPAALDHLQAVLQAGPNGEASFLRALARAILGGEDGTTSDLLDAEKAGFDLTSGFLRSADLMLRESLADEEKLKNLLTRMVTKRNDPSVKEGRDELALRARSRAAFLSKIGAPAARGAARDRLIFAQRLLSQALLDASDYLETGKESNLTDSELMVRAQELSRRWLRGQAVPVSVRWVGNQSARWGSCSTEDGTIRLSDRLQGMPQWVIDYVLLHELAHLIEANHSPKFHALLADYPHTQRAKGFLEGVTWQQR